MSILTVRGVVFNESLLVTGWTARSQGKSAMEPFADSIAHRAGVSEALAARFARRDYPLGSPELPTEANQTGRKPGPQDGRRGRAPRSRRAPAPMSFAPRRGRPGGG